MEELAAKSAAKMDKEGNRPTLSYRDVSLAVNDWGACDFLKGERAWGHALLLAVSPACSLRAARLLPLACAAGGVLCMQGHAF